MFLRITIFSHEEQDKAEAARVQGATLVWQGKKIESWHKDKEKRRYKLVRTDSYTDVPGLIIAADEATGECCIAVDGETKTLSLGPRGLLIVARSRTELAALPINLC